MAAPTLKGYATFSEATVLNVPGFGKLTVPPVRISMGLHKIKKDESGSVSFNRGCPSCQGKTEQRIVCEPCKQMQLKEADCLKLFTYEKGKPPVVFTKDEVEAIKAASGDKMCFVAEATIDASALDPLSIRDSYVMTPGNNKDDGKTFVTVREAIQGKAVIGRMLLYGKVRACAIVPNGRWMLMHALEYADSIRDTDALGADARAWTPDAADPDSVEGTQALINRLPGTFDLRSVPNGREEAVLAAVQARLANQPVVRVDSEVLASSAPTADLLAQVAAALRQSKKKAA